MPRYTKVDRNTDYGETMRNFFDAHNAQRIGTLLVARARLSVPIMTRMDGTGPNAIVTGSGGDPELEAIAGNRKRHAPAVATVISDERSGISVVHLKPEADSFITKPGPKAARLPITSFGRPHSPIIDYGMPMEHRDGSERFDALTAYRTPGGHELFGQTDNELSLISGGKYLDVYDAHRFTHPIFVFGSSYGKTLPAADSVADPLVQNALDQTINGHRAAA